MKIIPLLFRGLLWLIGGVAVLAVALTAFMLYKKDHESFASNPTGILEIAVPTADELKAPSRSFDDNPCRRLLLGNHETKSGDRLVLSYRRDNLGDLSAIDDEWYQALTVEVQSPLDNETITLPSPRVRVFYSRGGSAWVHHCAGQYATAGRGTLSLHRSWLGGVTARIELDLELKSARDDPKMSIEHISLDARFPT